jgi:hypothetical protein
MTEIKPKTYEDPEKAAAEPTEARRAAVESFILIVVVDYLFDKIVRRVQPMKTFFSSFTKNCAKSSHKDTFSTKST